MSRAEHPVLMCDGDDGMCGAWEIDYTLGGLGRIAGSASQLPDGWTGDEPDGDTHLCPEHCTTTPPESGDPS